MDYFFKYTSVNDQDKAWQLYLNVSGKYRYLPFMEYPTHTHPSSYYFSWENGRIIHEYQIIYITEGKGIFETKKASYNINGGSIIILRKGEWHRYRPLKEFGWTENYIGFDGELADFFLQKQEALRDLEVVDLGEQEVLIDTFDKIHYLVRNEGPCFQQIASGLIIKLLGYIMALENHKSFARNDVERIIQEVCYYIREHVEDEFNFESLALNYEFSCSYLRKMFKQYTGKSPHQYYLDMKIIRAKELISNTTMSMKEIALKLDFESIQYFSRLFKNKVGQSPTAFRK
jgi:AraC-like DNA-binding protein